MTRWIVLHSTQRVWLGRNVGYKSIGHGFYLEDGTETDNRLYSNIGIFARAAVDNHQNPRSFPGTLADNEDPESFRKLDTAPTAFPYRSDIEHPTVFCIANGWNDVIGNMAAGAGACGAAYWLVPSVNRDHVEVTDDDHKMTPMKWSGYAGLQKAGTPRVRTLRSRRSDPSPELRNIDDVLVPDDGRCTALPRHHRIFRHAQP